MKRFLQIANILSVVFAIVMNWRVATSDELPGIQNASNEVATFLTPASYVFSIWTLIYILITLLALYQARDFFRPNKKNTLPKKLSFWFILANIGNAFWTFVFVAGNIGLSLIVILTILLSLFMLIKRLEIALDDEPFQRTALVRWPILLYTGWVFIASVVNAASLYVSYGYTFYSWMAAVALVIVTIFLTILLRLRNARALVLASVWGIFGIVVAQYGENAFVWVPGLVVTVYLLAQVILHAYQNDALHLGNNTRKKRKRKKKQRKG